MNNFKKIIIPSIYATALVIIIGSVFFLVKGISNYLSEPIDYNYSIKNVFESVIPVVNTKELIVKPYLSEEVSIGKYYYDFEGEKTEQEKSLIYYEGTYMQNSGVDYVSSNIFDVIAILDGEVISVEKDETLGNIIQLKHDKDIISIYQGIEGASLEKGQKVNQGQILGTSGTSKINPEYISSLHFEIYYKGEIMDPENLYSLSIEDF